MGDFHRALEKAELHVHLEGSLDDATLLELDPGLSAEKIRAARRFHSFDGFIEAYKFVLARLREPGHFALALRRLLERMKNENVRYAEINLSVGVMLAWARCGSDTRSFGERSRLAGLSRSAVDIRLRSPVGTRRGDARCRTGGGPAGRGRGWV